MYKPFGKKLREERKNQNLTVQKVSEACGVTRSYITLIENGRRLPGKKIIPKIAVALNLKITIVLNWYLEDISHKIQTIPETS
jgi:transcriptional regulator with XRE-family HTH domain